MSATALASIDTSNLVMAPGSTTGFLVSAQEMVSPADQPTSGTQASALSAKRTGSCCTNSAEQPLERTATTALSPESTKTEEKEGFWVCAKKVDEAIASPSITNSMIAKSKCCSLSKSIPQGATYPVKPVAKVEGCHTFSRPISKDVTSRIELTKIERCYGSSSPAKRDVTSPTGTTSLAKGCCGSAKLANKESVLYIEPIATLEGICSCSQPADDETAPPVAKVKDCCSPSEPIDQGMEDHKLRTAVKMKGCSEFGTTCDNTTCEPAANKPVIPKAGCFDGSSSCTSPLALSIEPVERTPAEYDTDLGTLAGTEGDNEICPCCIKAAVQALVSGQSLQELNNLALRGSKTIRRCCRIFAKNCKKLACCLPVSRGRQRSQVSAGRGTLKEKPKSERIRVAKASFTEKPPKDLGKSGDRLQRSVFQVQGMDCASCTIKVVRAVSKLESAQSIEVDYFASRLTLDHDPSRVNPATVANFVSRATGFKVIPQFEDDDLTSCRMSLPIKTEKPFSQDDTDKYTVVSKKQYHQVIFNPKVHAPRSVFNDLEPFGATLVPRDQADDRKILARRSYHHSVLRSFACLVLVIPALVVTWGSPDLSFGIRHGIAFAAGSAIVLLSSSIWLGSIKSLVYLRHTDVQLLVAVSTITAYIFSVVAFSLGIAGVDFEQPFFETPALLLTLVQVGGTVQAYARRTVMQAATSLQTLQPGEALLLDVEKSTSIADHNQYQLIDTRLLGYGDVIQVGTNSVIAADGILIDNGGTIDESCMTGESVPVTKGVGSLVVAGCVNVGPPLHIHVSRLVHEDTAAKMADLVNRAHQTRLPVQDAADRIAATILPCTLAVAAISFLVWSLISRFVRDETSTDAGILGLTYAIAVVAVACPCALVLVSPMVIAMVVNIGLGTGVIFKSTAALWFFHDMDVFAFDKTGTLTEGKMRVLEANLLDPSFSPLIAALVADQSHPISKAISAHIGCAPDVLSHIKQRLSDPVVHPGRGLGSHFAGFALLGGSAEYTQAELEPDQNGDAASSVFYVTLGGLTVARFALQDMERPDAKELVHLLQTAGKRVVMISGDIPGPVERLAANIGLAPSDVNSRCSPAGKLDIIRDLQASGARVCYVGDGANDAAALAAADISIAIGGGADLAQATADITIASDRRLKNSTMCALALARLARWHIKVGFAWSIIYNIFAVLLASGAFVKVRIAPRWAGLGELASLLPIFAVAFGTRITWNFLLRRAVTGSGEVLIVQPINQSEGVSGTLLVVEQDIRTGDAREGQFGP